MTQLTRNGIAKDLKTSPYIFTEIIDNKKVDFYFSSMLHLNNFKKRREVNYNMIYNYIYKRFKFKYNCRMLADCNLYHKIETRGFYIKINHKEYLWPSSITLNGESKTSEKFAGWHEILMTKFVD